MHVAIFGLGTVGLSLACSAASRGHTISGVEIDAGRVQRLSSLDDICSEPGLREILREALNRRRLKIETDAAMALAGAKIAFCCVPTPFTGEADLSAYEDVVTAVAEQASDGLVFVSKSTVPPGTARLAAKRINDILKARQVSFRVPVVANPEFLREGQAICDMLRNPRVVIGADPGDLDAVSTLEQFYSAMLPADATISRMRRESAELLKYACNAFPAIKISFVGMLSEFAAKSGANIGEVTAALALDPRIGPSCLRPGAGYGGGCLPKDIAAFEWFGRNLGANVGLLNSTIRINTETRQRFIDRIVDEMPAKGTVALWGLAFKPTATTVTHSLASELVPRLLAAGHCVKGFDPLVRRSEPLNGIEYAKTPIDAARGADLLALLTECEEFRKVNLRDVAKILRGDLLFDAQSFWTKHEVENAGLRYRGVWDS